MSNKRRIKRKLPPELKRVQKKMRKVLNAPVRIPHPDDPAEQARLRSVMAKKMASEGDEE